MFARDSQILRNKPHFIIGVITINVFYWIKKNKVTMNKSRVPMKGNRFTENEQSLILSPYRCGVHSASLHG